MLALLYEVDLWCTWVPSFLGIGLQSAAVVAAEKPTRLAYHIHIGLPWPFRSRDAVIGVEGVDCMNPDDPVRQIVVLCSSGAAAPFFSAEAAAPAAEGATRAEVLDWGVVLTPAEVLPGEALPPGSLRFQMVGAVDPKAILPQWLP